MHETKILVNLEILTGCKIQIKRWGSQKDDFQQTFPTNNNFGEINVGILVTIGTLCKLQRRENILLVLVVTAIVTHLFFKKISCKYLKGV